MLQKLHKKTTDRATIRPTDQPTERLNDGPMVRPTDRPTADRPTSPPPGPETTEERIARSNLILSDSDRLRWLLLFDAFQTPTGLDPIRPQGPGTMLSSNAVLGDPGCNRDPGWTS